MNVDATRMQKEVQQQAKWPRSLGDFTRLAENEKGLAGEMADVAKKELTSTPVICQDRRESREEDGRSRNAR